MPIHLLLFTVLLTPPQTEGPATLVGKPAPAFELEAATKDSILDAPVRLSDIVGSEVIVLAFYPADWSGGCTREMCDFRDQFSALQDLHAHVFGISGDYVYSHHEWAKALGLPFPLLSDHSHSVARTYMSFNDRSGYNFRTIFVIDTEGIISYADPRFKAGDDAAFERVQAAIKAATREGQPRDP